MFFCHSFSTCVLFTSAPRQRLLWSSFVSTFLSPPSASLVSFLCCQLHPLSSPRLFPEAGGPSLRDISHCWPSIVWHRVEGLVTAESGACSQGQRQWEPDNSQGQRQWEPDNSQGQRQREPDKQPGSETTGTGQAARVRDNENRTSSQGQRQREPDKQPGSETMGAGQQPGTETIEAWSDPCAVARTLNSGY